MTRKIKWPSMEELLKLNLRSHDEFGQMQPLWFLQDLERLQGIKQPRNPKPLPLIPMSDEEYDRLYPAYARSPAAKKTGRKSTEKKRQPKKPRPQICRTFCSAVSVS
jgi:hypothetical protein